MSRSYNIAIPIVAVLALAWLASSAFLRFSWATFCVSILHLSGEAVLRIHVISAWLILVCSVALLVLHLAIMLVATWRRQIRPRALCHIAMFAFLYLALTYGAIVQGQKFRSLYRFFAAQWSQASCSTTTCQTSAMGSALVAALGIMRVSLDAKGAVTAVQIIKSSGNKALDFAAREAFRSWRAGPGRSGRFFDIPVTFSAGRPSPQLPDHLGNLGHNPNR